MTILARLQAWGLALLSLLLAAGAAFGIGRYSGGQAAKKQASVEADAQKAQAAQAVAKKTTDTVQAAKEVEHQVQEMPDDEARKALADRWTRG